MSETTIPNGCTCPECVKMCRCHPCSPTLDEAKQLIKAGYANQLMLKVWASQDDPQFAVVGLCPAIIGYELMVDPMKSYAGDCVFLKSDRCILHDKGLKPLEGRFATHDTTPEQEERVTKEIIKTWLTQEADDFLLEWERMCGVKIQRSKP